MKKPRCWFDLAPVVTDHFRAERAGVPGGPVEEWRTPVEVTPLNLWVVVELESGWQAAYRLVAQDGRLVVGEIRVHPEPASVTGAQQKIWSPGDWAGALRGVSAVVPAGGITSRVLKQVRIGAHITEVRDELDLEWAIALRASEHGLFTRLREAGLQTFEKSPQGPRDGAGRRGLSTTEYMKLVKAYEVAIASRSRHPVQDAAKSLGIRYQLARDRLHRARRMGLLAPTRQGRAGGLLLKVHKSRRGRRRS